MALNLQQIRDYVRSHLDIEIEDLPDAVLDVFIAEGFHRCFRAERRLPFYRKRWDLTTTASTSAYELTSIAEDIEEIAAIQGPRYNLRWIGADEADRAFPLNVTSEAEPYFFTVEGDTLYLYPTPNDAYNLVVKGYRTPADLIAGGTGAEPDLPVDLHNTVATWALARAYGQQDDPEMASMYERQFADEINLFRRRLNSMPMQQPIVLNGGSGVGTPSRLRYDWE